MKYLSRKVGVLQLGPKKRNGEILKNGSNNFD
jgi:hypothetical protein